MATHRKHGGKRPGAGRPTLVEGEATVPVTIRMSETQRDEFKAAGGPRWVRGMLDKRLKKKTPAP